MATIRMLSVPLPFELVKLLESNILSSNFSLYNFLLKHKQLAKIVDYSFSDFNWRSDKVILNAQGFNQFRNRICSIYLHYAIYGYFPKQADLYLLEKVLETEKRIENHIIEGYSRAFMLAYYQQMLEITFEGPSLFTIEEQTVDLLNLTTSRVVKIDWLLILVEHFRKYLGEKDLRLRLEQGSSYEELYEMIDCSEKEELLANLLHYGQSIYTPEIFFETVV